MRAILPPFGRGFESFRLEEAAVCAFADRQLPCTALRPGSSIDARDMLPDDSSDARRAQVLIDHDLQRIALIAGKTLIWTDDWYHHLARNRNAVSSSLLFAPQI